MGKRVNDPVRDSQSAMGAQGSGQRLGRELAKDPFLVAFAVCKQVSGTRHRRQQLLHHHGFKLVSRLREARIRRGTVFGDRRTAVHRIQLQRSQAPR